MAWMCLITSDLGGWAGSGLGNPGLGEETLRPPGAVSLTFAGQSISGDNGQMDVNGATNASTWDKALKAFFMWRSQRRTNWQ